MIQQLDFHTQKNIPDSSIQDLDPRPSTTFIRQNTSEYVRIRQNTSEYVWICQGTGKKNNLRFTEFLLTPVIGIVYNNLPSTRSSLTYVHRYTGYHNSTCTVIHYHHIHTVGPSHLAPRQLVSGSVFQCLHSPLLDLTWFTRYWQVLHTCVTHLYVSLHLCLEPNTNRGRRQFCRSDFNSHDYLSHTVYKHISVEKSEDGESVVGLISIFMMISRHYMCIYNHISCLYLLLQMYTMWVWKNTRQIKV